MFFKTILRGKVMSRGSEWGRWDLHVHTKGTAKNDKFGDISFEDYCVQLFRKALERNIKVIGIILQRRIPTSF